VKLIMMCLWKLVSKVTSEHDLSFELTFRLPVEEKDLVQPSSLQIHLARPSW
jgi:hypothetical protein